MLSYRIQGNGTPLVLLHGWGVTFEIWQDLLPLLTPHFQVIMVELPGHGASPFDSSSPYFAACADSLDELRRHLNLNQWSLLCYSIGAWAGRSYYEQYAAQVNKIIFLCPLFITGWRMKVLRFICWLDSWFPLFVNFILKTPLLYPLIVIIGFTGRPHPYAVIWLSKIQSQNVSLLKYILKQIPRSPHMRLPVWYLWGRTDILAPAPKLREARDVLINGNHSAPMLAAAEIAAKVNEWLK